ncbi:MAG: hypothetical protein PVF59_03960 [Desulfobacterales bacterium]|jgi:nickel transport protein
MKLKRRAPQHHRSDLGLLLGVLTILLSIVPATARAHNVSLFAWVEEGQVFTQSKFSGGRLAKNARIEVFNAAGEKLLEGRTDEQGQFAFTPPRPEALRIVLLAGSGHRGEWRVAADEFGLPPADAPLASSPSVASPPPPDAATPPQDTPAPTDTELKTLIEGALEKKLAPIRRQLAQLAQRPSLHDIIGGLGYIMGLVGLGAYMQSRRKSG